MTNENAAFIQSQIALLKQTMLTLLAPGEEYALIDFPDHGNVGDSAIWLGECKLLRALTGRGHCYVSTWHDFDEAAFREACPEGILFLHGGGGAGRHVSGIAGPGGSAQPHSDHRPEPA